MVKIRLRRVGAKKQPTYRIVVADSRAPRDGRFIEIIGHYNPRTEPPTVEVLEDRALYWLSQGAQPSGAVELFFRRLGLPEKLEQVRAGQPVEAVAAPRPQRAAASAGKRKPKAEAIEEAPPAPVADVVQPAAESAEEPAKVVAAKAEETTEAAATTAREPEETPAADVAPETATEPAAAKPKRARAAAGPTLAELELSARVAKALQDAGIETVKDLEKLLADGDEKLLALPGIGAKAVEEVREKMAAHGATPGA